jgi:hypothetical protein
MGQQSIIAAEGPNVAATGNATVAKPAATL